MPAVLTPADVCVSAMPLYLCAKTTPGVGISSGRAYVVMPARRFFLCLLLFSDQLQGVLTPNASFSVCVG